MSTTDFPAKSGGNSSQVYLLAVPAIIMAQALVLWAMGRSPICTCGYVKLWHGLRDSENSQHIFDLYSFTHVIHGFLLYLVLWLMRRRTPLAQRLMLAVVIEGAWEVIENSNFIIDRYRAQTASRTYYGDSIVNSVSDTITMAIGFLLASWLPARMTIAIAIALEAALAYLIRDNLGLNVIMLVHPFGAIKAW